MLKIFSVLAAGTLAFCVLPSRAELVSGISVVVNDSVITYAEIEEEVVKGATLAAQPYANDPQRYAQRYNEEAQRLRAQDIELFVEDKLIVHEFNNSPYTTNILEGLIDEQIQKDIDRNYYGDRARLIQTLRKEGKTYEEYRRIQRDQFIIEYENYQNNSNLRKILISPLKIEQYYDGHKDEFKVDDQVHLRMIVVNKVADSAPDYARKVADEIMAKIDSGVPFAEMAGVYSSGPQALRTEGGDRGWVERSLFKAEISKVAFSLKPGQHSGVIDLPEACYLLMVEDVRPAHDRPLAEVRDDIERTLRAQESQRLRKLWIERLKRKSSIQYY